MKELQSERLNCYLQCCINKGKHPLGCDKMSDEAVPEWTNAWETIWHLVLNYDICLVPIGCPSFAFFQSWMTKHDCELVVSPGDVLTNWSAGSLQAQHFHGWWKQERFETNSSCVTLSPQIRSCVVFFASHLEVRIHNPQQKHESCQYLNMSLLRINLRQKRPPSRALKPSEKRSRTWTQLKTWLVN